MSGFVNRVASWLANEVIVKKLSQSQSFQRAAAKTVEKMDKAQSSVGSGASKIADMKSGFKSESSKFWEVMKDEIKKDFEKTVSKK